MIVFHLVDDVAEHYLRLLDSLHEEVDELEHAVREWSATRVQRRVSDLRHDVIVMRRTLGPTRDAVRSVVDGRTDIEGRPLFKREVFSPRGRAALRAGLGQAAARERGSRLRARPARERA